MHPLYHTMSGVDTDVAVFLLLISILNEKRGTEVSAMSIAIITSPLSPVPPTVLVYCFGGILT